MEFLQVFVVIVLGSVCDGYRILAVLPIASTSHQILSERLVDGLARRGHQVTFLTSRPRNKTLDNITEVNIRALDKWLTNVRSKISHFKKPNFFENYQYVTDVTMAAVDYVIQDKVVQDFMAEDHKFDAAIVAECTTPGYMAIGQKFQVPIVVFSTMPLFPWTSFRLGNSDLPSWVSNIYSKRLQYQNFWDRFVNAIYYLYAVVHDTFIMLPKHAQVIKEHLPRNPDFIQNIRNVSLVLTNSHTSTYEASLQMPNMVEIGGFHIDPPQALPEDLKSFLDNSTKGVILFAMGSHCQMSQLPEATLNAIWKTFAKFSQTVLMKWETDDLPARPSNVKLVKWIPQKDVLAHPNIRVFITHGGLLSTLETLYFGVPIIGIPVTFDQGMNIEFAEHYGYGKMLPLTNITESSLTSTLKEVLFKPSYRENTQIRSKIMKDRPLSAMDSANYWIEYVIRHNRGEHLRYKAVEQSWYQTHLFDVMTFALIGVILASKLIPKVIYKSKCQKVI